ncbi:recombinase [Synergistales bacterium]|nr:recombinase [Synergistales bacterium]
MKMKLTQAFVQSLKAEDKPYWIRDAQDSKLLLYVGRTKTWYVDYKGLDGKRNHHKIGHADVVTVAMARDVAREFLARLELGDETVEKHTKRGALTLQELIETHYEPWVLANRRTGKETIKMLKNLFGDFLESPVVDLSVTAVEKWRDAKRQNLKLKAASLNREITALKSLLNWAERREIINANPLARLEPLREDDSDRKIRYLSGDERDRLHRSLVFAPEYLRVMVFVSLNTGIRRGSLFALEWRDVDFDNGVLTVRPAADKSEKGYHVPINQAAADALVSWRKDNTDGLVFPSATGTEMDNVRNSWATLLKTAEIENFRWHDMRHDFASQLVMKGVDLNTVRELLGHADMKMTLRYAHLAPQVKKAAVDLIG